MMMRKTFFALTFFAVSAFGASAYAETVKESSAALEKQLASHDPKAVAAARHYYESPAVKAGLVAIMENMNKSMAQVISQQNPKITQQQLDEVKSIVSSALTERLDLLLQMNMLIALDTFTTDELVALDKFYSSPEGTSIMGKMPKVAEQLPAVMQKIMPDYLADVKNRIQAKGVELKL